MSQMVKIKIRCIRCRDFKEFEVPKKQFEEYSSGNSGKMIQDIFPNLEPWKREMFISRFCDECYNNVTKEPEEEETLNFDELERESNAEDDCV